MDRAELKAVIAEELENIEVLAQADEKAGRMIQAERKRRLISAVREYVELG